MVDSEDFTLEKIKTQELSLEIIILSDTFQQNTSIKEPPQEPSQNEAVDLYIESKPQFNKYFSFCHKNNHSVSTCYRRLNIPKKSKPQSKLPTSSFYQHFKTLSNKNSPETHLCRSRSNSNPYQKFSREPRFKSRSLSRSNSCSHSSDEHHPHNHSSYYDRNRSSYDHYYRKSPSRTGYPPHPPFDTTPSRSTYKYYPRSRERSSC